MRYGNYILIREPRVKGMISIRDVINIICGRCKKQVVLRTVEEFEYCICKECLSELKTLNKAPKPSPSP